MVTIGVKAAEESPLLIAHSTASLQCPPPPLDVSVTVKGLKSGNFNSNFYFFWYGLRNAWIRLYEVWAHGVCFAKLPLKFQNF